MLSHPHAHTLKVASKRVLRPLVRIGQERADAVVELEVPKNLRSRPVRVHRRKREQASHIQAFLRGRRHDSIFVEIVNVTEMNRVYRLRGVSWVYDNRLGESA